MSFRRYGLRQNGEMTHILCPASTQTAFYSDIGSAHQSPICHEFVDAVRQVNRSIGIHLLFALALLRDRYHQASPPKFRVLSDSPAFVDAFQQLCFDGVASL